jgi:hypothetical protein
MGDPMPFKRSSISVPAPLSSSESEARQEDEEEEKDAVGNDAVQEKEAVVPVTPVRAPSVPPLARLPSIPTAASPPPIPTKSPPPVATSTLEKRLSRLSTSEDSSLGRRASLLSRPPVPRTSLSRDASQEQEGETGEMEEDHDEVDELRSTALSPPPLPVSPPPRAPPRVAPRPPSTIIDDAATTAPLAAPVADAPAVSPDGAPPSRRSTQLQSAPRSARDLDLMPSSQWWRHGIPVKLPPTLLRPDAVPFVSTQNIGNRHLIKVDVIFEDYSSTVVEVHFEDDDAAEDATQLLPHPVPLPSNFKRGRKGMAAK